MTTQQISYFLALAETLHFWDTSYQLHITQSALSRQIKALEDELQVELFKRTNRKVELTAAGKFLQQQWAPLTEQLQATLYYAQKIHKGEGGSVVINHPGSISHDVLPDLLTRISTTFPHIKIELLQVKHTDEFVLLKNFKVDLCYSRHLHKADFLSSKLVRQDRLALVVPKAHPIRKLSDITMKSLKDERFILSTLSASEVYQTKMEQVFSKYGIEPDVRFESDFGSVILSLVEKGLGISIIPLSYSHSNPPGIRFIQIPFEVPLYLHWRKNEENKVINHVMQLAMR